MRLALQRIGLPIKRGLMKPLLLRPHVTPMSAAELIASKLCILIMHLCWARNHPRAPRAMASRPTPNMMLGCYLVVLKARGASCSHPAWGMDVAALRHTCCRSLHARAAHAHIHHRGIICICAREREHARASLGHSEPQLTPEDTCVPRGHPSPKQGCTSSSLAGMCRAEQSRWWQADCICGGRHVEHGYGRSERQRRCDGNHACGSWVGREEV